MSERKQAEQALRDSEARYRDLFDNASDLVCTTALDGTLPLREPAWHEAIGSPDEQLAGRRFPDLVHPDSRERYRRRRGARRGGRDAGTRRPGPGHRRGNSAHPRGQHQLHLQRRPAAPAPRHLSRRDRAEAGRGAAPAGGAHAGRRAPGGRRGARGQQHDDRRHRVQRVPDAEPGARRPAPEPRSPRSSRRAPAPPTSPASCSPSPASSSSARRCCRSTAWSRTSRRCCAGSSARTMRWSWRSTPMRGRSAPTAGSSSRFWST